MIAVIDVAGNNLTSLANSLKRLGFDFVLTHSISTIQRASHVILPGVGSAKVGMEALNQANLIKTLRHLEQPLLGICLGMQLLFEQSEEGHVDCLGLLPGIIQRIPARQGFTIPHMGWNCIEWCEESPMQQGLSQEEYLYFVHSYAYLNKTHALARCQYTEPFTAIVQSKNIFGMQFHPEKSSRAGLTLLNNFLSMEPVC